MMQSLTERSIKAVAAGTEESNSENIRSALQRGLPEFGPALCAHDGHFVIVASGPSVTSFLEEIKEERVKGRTICSINGAHDWLVENGLEPDLFVTCDPKTTILGNVKNKNNKTIYLLASRAHPEVFEHLKDKRIVVWHSFASKPGSSAPTGKEVEWADFNPLDECEVWKGKFGVGGGSTSGLRAVTLGYIMGFRKFIFYGLDSCLAADRKTKRFTGETTPEKNVLDVIVDGKRFWANHAMADQAIQFQKMIDQLTGIQIEVKGTGLIAAIMEARKKRGYS